MPPLFLQVSSKGIQAVHIIVPLILESVQDMNFSNTIQNGKAVEGLGTI